MGNNVSQEENDHVGYRVLGVQPHSPASDCGLVSFFDFIIAANGIPLRTLDTTLIDLIKASEDLILPLTIYNCKSNTKREVSLIPSRNWPGEGMLGITIRFDSYYNTDDYICHVIDIESNSPADLSGLISEKDYILGTSEKIFKDIHSLYEELNENIHKTIEFYVYNIDTDEVRTVVIMPSNEWGGEGILGANIASGYLHRIPIANKQTNGRASDGYFKSSVNSPFGSNIPPLQSVIPYTNLDTPPLLQPHITQPLSIHSSAPMESSPMMSLEDCKKLAIEVQSTALKLEGTNGTHAPNVLPSLTATGV